MQLFAHYSQDEAARPELLRRFKAYLDANPNGYCPVHATGVTCNPGSRAG